DYYCCSYTTRSTFLI
nr:immunoglobulin light chain junction region [Macaca mulatta]MOY16790.1 immunoglobulin light chain junction region [Macaca mulatta]MOY17196.1 immunoglobulin light chain junction region [Macaca mulatta]